MALFTFPYSLVKRKTIFDEDPAIVERGILQTGKHPPFPGAYPDCSLYAFAS